MKFACGLLVGFGTGAIFATWFTKPLWEQLDMRQSYDYKDPRTVPTAPSWERV